VLEERRSFRTGNRWSEGWVRVCGCKEGQKLWVIRARIRNAGSVSSECRRRTALAGKRVREQVEEEEEREKEEKGGQREEEEEEEEGGGTFLFLFFLSFLYFFFFFFFFFFFREPVPASYFKLDELGYGPGNRLFWL